MFQVRQLNSFLSLCYVCNSEVIHSIIHLQSANFIKLNRAGSIANNETLFHLTIWDVGQQCCFLTACSPSVPSSAGTTTALSGGTRPSSARSRTPGSEMGSSSLKKSLYLSVHHSPGWGALATLIAIQAPAVLEGVGCCTWDRWVPAWLLGWVLT